LAAIELQGIVMRRWVKHRVFERGAQQPSLDHFALMGGYLGGPEYGSRESFFAAHLDAHERLVECERYLAPRIKTQDRILSVASGRCAVELRLQKAVGCRIVCSDLAEPPCLGATKALFPELEFRVLDALGEPPSDQFDAVISINLIYNFNDQQLSRFFDFVAKALNPGGRLFLDFAGSSDNAAGLAFHDFYLSVEARLAAAALTFKHRRPFAVARDAHGYRRTSEDVKRIAQSRGFAMSEYWEGDYTTDFQRSLVLHRLSRASAAVRRGLSVAGRLLPYVRIATFSQQEPFARYSSEAKS
jgi:SAM-dependent methyltransferase